MLASVVFLGSLVTSPSAFAGFAADEKRGWASLATISGATMALLTLVAFVSTSLDLDYDGPRVFRLAVLVTIAFAVGAGSLLWGIARLFGARGARPQHALRLAVALGWVFSVVSIPAMFAVRLGREAAIGLTCAGLLWCFYVAGRGLIALGASRMGIRIAGLSLGAVVGFASAWYLALWVYMDGGFPRAGIAGSSPNAFSAVEGVGSVEVTGPMRSARHDHTATLLRDGRVLVVGGRAGAYDVLASAEVWDPRLGNWTAAGALAEARAGHAATLLKDGRVLVTGGWGYAPPREGGARRTLASAEVFEPATGRWRAFPAMLEGRMDHTATLLDDGRVLVIGGTGHSVLGASRTQIWNPRTGQWTWGPSLAIARSQHVALRLSDGSVLVAGGELRFTDGSFARPYFATTELFRSRNDRSFPTGDDRFFLTSRLTEYEPHFAGTVLPDGRALLVGSLMAEVWDPRIGSWSLAGPLPRHRWEGLNEPFITTGTATALPDGRVVHAGGYAAQSLPDVGVLDTASFSWEEGPKLKWPRTDHTATALPDGRVLIAGGSFRKGDSSAEIGEAELFVPSARTARAAAPAALTPRLPESRWRVQPGLRYPRFGHTVTPLGNGTALVAGGEQGAEDGTDRLASEIVSLGAPPLDALAPNEPRSQHCAVRLDRGRVMIVGGRRRPDEPALASAEIYDSKIHGWTPTGKLSQGRLGHTATVLADGGVLVVGGIVQVGGGAAIQAELWTPSDGLWHPAGALHQARLGHTATLLPDGRVLVVGGSTADPTSVELWNPQERVFIAGPHTSDPRTDHAAVLLANGQVLVAGGATEGSSSEIYDPASGSWTRVGALAFPHQRPGLELLLDGSVLLASGSLNSLSSASAVVERFDPSTARWSLVANLRTGHDGPLCFAPGGAVMVVGGRSDLFGAPASGDIEAWVPWVGDD